MLTIEGHAASVDGVAVYNWNPRRSLIPGPIGRRIRLPYGRRQNNFGDLIGPTLVDAIVSKALGKVESSSNSDRKLFAIGSVLHFASSDDVVWGTGVNGKVPADLHKFSGLDVRAVRGPRTRDFLRTRGVEVPPIFGDPALLLPRFFPELEVWAAQKSRAVTIVPNLNDWPKYRGTKNVLNPRAPLWRCLRAIAESERVVASSLHGIIVAEALGIPVAAIQPGKEHPFKYQDYFEGTGRAGVRLHDDLSSALRTGSVTPPMNWNEDALLSAFPFDMWSSSLHNPRTSS